MKSLGCLELGVHPPLWDLIVSASVPGDLALTLLVPDVSLCKFLWLHCDLS